MMVGIIGTRWGYFLGTQLRSFYGGHITVCGRDPKRTRKVSGLLGAGEESLDWRSLRNSKYLTHIIVAVPPGLNLEIAGSLLRAGKQVLVEKPLACTLEDCDALIAVGQAMGSVLAVGENTTFRPALCEAKKRLAEIGEPRLLVATAVHSSRYRDPGILLDFAIHYIRAVRCLFGEPDTVFASQARNFTRGSDDNVVLVLGSSLGWQAVITLSWQASAGVNPEFLITGTRGAMKIWPSSKSIDIYPTEPGKLTRAIARIRPTSLRQRLESSETQRRRIQIRSTDLMGYQEELRDFLGKTAPDVNSAVEARRDILIAKAAYEALKTKRIVEIGCTV